MQFYGLRERDYSKQAKGVDGKFVSTQHLSRKEYKKEYLKIYSKINREKIRKKLTAWRQTPSGKASRYKEYSSLKGKLADKLRTKKYRATEKGRLTYLLNRHKRIAREKNIVNDFTKQEWITLCESVNGFCKGCNHFIGINKLTIDHNPPISKAPKGFVYTINDIQPLCNACNASKGNNWKHGKEDSEKK